MAAKMRLLCRCLAATWSVHCRPMQSASTEYFRKARGFLMEHGRLGLVSQFVVNPDDTAYSNLTSTCTNKDALDLHLVCTTADAAMTAVAAAVRGEVLEVGGVPAQPAVAPVKAQPVACGSEDASAPPSGAHQD